MTHPLTHCIRAVYVYAVYLFTQGRGGGKEGELWLERQ
jgi:hypothetical protein